MQLARVPPASRKFPPAYSAEPLPSSKTVNASPKSAIPFPPVGLDQAPLLQRAMLLATTEPDPLNDPPANSSGPPPKLTPPIAWTIGVEELLNPDALNPAPTA